MITALVAALVIHPGGVPSALAKVGGDGSVHLRLRFDALSYVLDQTPAETSEESLRKLLALPEAELDKRMEEAEARFEKALGVTASGGKLRIDSATFPRAATVQQTFKKHGHLPLLLLAFAKAKLPQDSKTISFRFPDVVDTVVLTIERDGFEPYSEKLRGGQASKPIIVKFKS